jgi:carboxymethylenebutenolidase
MSTSEITIESGDATFPAYRVMPRETPAPAVILISPVFGVTPGMRGIAGRYAERGYIAVAPDSFWRQHPGPLPRSVREAAMKRAREVSREEVLGDIAATAKALRAMPECNGKIGIAGFCFGGRYAFLAAARGLVDAAASFHGTAIGEELAEAKAINVPLSFHFGDSDPVVPIEEVEAIRAALQGKPNVEIAVYRGAAHGFTDPDGPGYNREVTERSEERAFAMFESLKLLPSG